MPSATTPHALPGMILREVRKAVIGKDLVLTKVLIAFLAGGHVLMEDMPGVGKTTLAMAFSKALGLSCRRVQFTPDVLPSDLTGFSVYEKSTEKFVFQPGALFCHLLLADEINRTSSKTQAALLGGDGRRKCYGRGKDLCPAPAASGYRHAEPSGLCGNAVPAGISAGSLFDAAAYGVSGN